MSVQTIAVVGAVLGVVTRTLVPYLMTLKEKPDTKFDKSFLVPAAVSVLLNLFLVPVLLGTLSGTSGFLGGYVLGYGVQDMARDGMKIVSAVRNGGAG